LLSKSSGSGSRSPLPWCCLRTWFKTITLTKTLNQTLKFKLSNNQPLIPSLKPLLNLRGTLRRYLILPVPVVFLLMAFTLQLSETINDSEPNLHTNACNLISRKLTFSCARSGESTRRTPTLLKVEAATTTPHTERVSLVPPLTEAPCSFSLHPCQIDTLSDPSHNQIHLRSIQGKREKRYYHCSSEPQTLVGGALYGCPMRMNLLYRPHVIFWASLNFRLSILLWAQGPIK